MSNETLTLLIALWLIIMGLPLYVRMYTDKLSLKENAKSDFMQGRIVIFDSETEGQ